ncbi:MAG: ATP-binding protein [Candidatus Limnocylindria bacterium]
MNRMREPALAVASLAAATLAALALRNWVGVENPSSVYLLSVAAIALRTGTSLAVATAVGAFLLYNFLFVEPRFTLAVAEPQSLLTLLLLLVIGLIIGRLTSVGRDRAAESARREREARALFAVSRVLATAPRADQALPAVAARIATETEMDRVWIGLGVAPTPERIVADTNAATPLPTSSQPAVLRRAGDEDDARWTRIHRQMPRVARSTGNIFRVDIAAGDERSGSLYGLRAAGSGDPSKETSRLLAVAADQIAQALRCDRLASRARDVEVAERSDAAKSALLDLVSHELRTPLAAIRASAGSLAEPSLALSRSDRQGLAEAIDSEAMRLNRLVGNLLDMSRLQAGRMSADIEVIPVQDAVEGVLEHLRPALGGRAIEVTIPADLAPVLADAVFLEQVLANLVENAARYTPSDAPIRVQALAAPHEMLELRVEDGGGGVPDEQLTTIFERFFRGDASHQRSGTGLGLALVRGLVEAMSGEVSAQRSSLGGLAVTVRLPAAGPAA